MTIDNAARVAMNENRAWWDAATAVNYRSRMYDVPGFLAGENKLDRFIVDEVGDVPLPEGVVQYPLSFNFSTLGFARQVSTALPSDVG